MRVFQRCTREMPVFTTCPTWMHLRTVMYDALSVERYSLSVFEVFARIVIIIVASPLAPLHWFVTSNR